MASTWSKPNLKGFVEGHSRLRRGQGGMLESVFLTCKLP